MSEEASTVDGFAEVGPKVVHDWLEPRPEGRRTTIEEGRALQGRLRDALVADDYPRERFGIGLVVDVPTGRAQITLNLNDEAHIRLTAGQAEALCIYLEAKRETLESS